MVNCSGAGVLYLVACVSTVDDGRVTVWLIAAGRVYCT